MLTIRAAFGFTSGENRWLHVWVTGSVRELAAGFRSALDAQLRQAIALDPESPGSQLGKCRS